MIDIRFVISCHTVYHNCQHLLLKLNRIQRSFLDFLIERMTQDHWLLATPNVKSEFIQFLSEMTSDEMSISIRSLDKYLADFVTLHLLIKSKQTCGGYYINPKYFGHGGSGGREAIIKRMFKKAAMGEIELEPLLEMPISEYIKSNIGP